MSASGQTAYEGVPVAGPLCALQRSKRGPVSALRRNSVVPKPASEGQRLARSRPERWCSRTCRPRTRALKQS